MNVQKRLPQPILVLTKGTSCNAIPPLGCPALYTPQYSSTRPPFLLAYLESSSSPLDEPVYGRFNLCLPPIRHASGSNPYITCNANETDAHHLQTYCKCTERRTIYRLSGQGRAIEVCEVNQRQWRAPSRTMSAQARQ